MKVQITINTDSAAFVDNCNKEVDRILEGIDYETPIECPLRDINGNAVGEVSITE